MAGRARLGATPLVCARWESAVPGHPPAHSLPTGATSRCVLPLPPRPGSAPLDFDLPGRKHLGTWCFGAHCGWRDSQSSRTASFQALLPRGVKEALDTAQELANQMEMWPLVAWRSSHVAETLCPGVQLATVLQGIGLPTLRWCCFVPDGGSGGLWRLLVVILLDFSTSTCMSLPSWALLARFCFLNEHSRPVPSSL